MTNIIINGVERNLTEDELNNRSPSINLVDAKLTNIKEMRLARLQETDFYALQDVTMSNEMKTWRLNLRNIPQDYTTEAEYDLLLARDENGNLTHSVWSKP
jgi:hypothetical protein